MADFFTPCSCYDLRSQFYVLYPKYRVVTNKCIFEEKCLCVFVCVSMCGVCVCMCLCVFLKKLIKTKPHHKHHTHTPMQSCEI